MSDNKGGYGYVEDEEAIGGTSAFKFGLNTPVFMTKFAYITDAGQGGTEGEAIDIEFTSGESVKNYRRFPVTKAFLKNNKGETEDPNSPEMIEAFMDFNAINSHILGVFIPQDDIKAAYSVRLNSFKHYAEIAIGLLPKDFDKMPLDLFMQYQWQISGENNTTFLEIPKKMKQGRWLMKAVDPSSDKGWKMIKKENAEDNDANGITFVDEAGNVHPLKRNGWFANSNFANRQTTQGNSNISGNPSGSGVGAGNPQGTATLPPPSNW